jgi:hypothetical protein
MALNATGLESHWGITLDACLAQRKGPTMPRYPINEVKAAVTLITRGTLPHQFRTHILRLFCLWYTIPNTFDF